MDNMRECGPGPSGLEWRAGGHGLYAVGFGTPTSQPSPLLHSRGFKNRSRWDTVRYLL